MKRWKIVYVNGRAFDEVVTAASFTIEGGAAVFRNRAGEITAAIGSGSWFTVMPESSQ